MNRRAFLKATGSVVAAATVSKSALASPGLPLAFGRLTLPINRGWSYSSRPPANLHHPEFDDSTLTRIIVPHSNRPPPWRGFDDSECEFISAYRRGIKIPEDAKAKRVFVDFEGVMVASTVYCNGKRLGEYRGGYTPFSFELMSHLRVSGKNVLSVDVDATERKDIPPFGNEVDYLTFGGIYL